MTTSTGCGRHSFRNWQLEMTLKLNARGECMSNEKIINRWLVVLGAVLIQLCLGALYAWSVFTPTLKNGSSPNSGEGSPDLEEEIFIIKESVSHPLDHLDFVVDTFKQARVQRVKTVRNNP